jgi:hypothetical protein
MESLRTPTGKNPGGQSGHSGETMERHGSFVTSPVIVIIVEKFTGIYADIRERVLI